MRTNFAVGLATLYLVVLTILGQSAASPTLCTFMYLFSPLVIVIMVYLVLTEKNFNYPELAEGEEWGYRDKNKNELGLF
jgi:hypothetical protein